MKAAVVLVGLTVLNAAFRLGPSEPSVVEPVGAEVGTLVAADLLPPTATGCAMVIFFEEDCPYCGHVASAFAGLSGDRPPTTWVTSDTRSGMRFEDQLPAGDRIFLSRALPEALGVTAVPAAVWIEDGRIVAKGALSGREAVSDLNRPCTAESSATD